MASKTDIVELQAYVESQDPEAFRACVARYQRAVYAVCCRVLNDSTAAEDATQETFLKLSKNADKIRSNVGAWLHQCAQSTATDMLRSEIARSRRNERWQEGRETQVNVTDWEELTADIDACLSDISSDERELIIQYYFNQRTLKDVAGDLTLSVSGTKKRLDRAIATLRDRLLHRNLAIAGPLLALLLADNASGRTVPAGLSQSLQVVAGRPSGTAIGVSAVIGLRVVAIILPVLLAAYGFIPWLSRAPAPTDADADREVAETVPTQGAHVHRHRVPASLSHATVGYAFTQNDALVATDWERYFSQFAGIHTVEDAATRWILAREAGIDLTNEGFLEATQIHDDRAYNHHWFSWYGAVFKTWARCDTTAPLTWIQGWQRRFAKGGRSTRVLQHWIGEIARRAANAEFTTTLHWLENEGDPAMYPTTLRSLAVENIEPEQAVALAQHFNKLTSVKHRKDFIPWLVRSWASVNPRETADWALTLPNRDDQIHALYKTIIWWGRQDRQEMLDWLSTVPDSHPTYHALMTAASKWSWSGTDPDGFARVMALLTEHSTTVDEEASSDDGELWRRFIQHWSALQDSNAQGIDDITNAPLRTAIQKQLKAGRSWQELGLAGPQHIASDRRREHIFRMVARQHAADDAVSAIRWARSQAEETDRRAAMNGVARGLPIAWVRANPTEVFELLPEIQSPGMRNRVLRPILNMLIDDYDISAKNLLRSIPLHSVPDTIRGSFIRRLVAIDIPLAHKFLETTKMTTPNSDYQWLQEAYRRIAVEDLTAAEALVPKIDNDRARELALQGIATAKVAKSAHEPKPMDSHTDSIIIAQATRLARRNPAAAALLLEEQNIVPSYHSELIRDLVDSWVLIDPHAAAQWTVSTLTDGKDSNKLLFYVALRWGSREPAAAMDWVEELDAEVRMYGRSGLVSGMEIAKRGSSVRYGLEILDTISSPSGEQIVRSITRSVLHASREEAASWLEKVDQPQITDPIVKKHITDQIESTFHHEHLIRLLPLVSNEDVRSELAAKLADSWAKFDPDAAAQWRSKW